MVCSIFRRELVYKEYCIKMKDRYPSIEEYKSLIFLSTFGQKRVVIDPNIFNLYADNAHKTHSYCVPIYDEIKSIPQHVWENIRLFLYHIFFFLLKIVLI